ncbi:hypothetical protein CcaverHIS002_0208080 [Cutaneotrichosporon cavernicola]|uniref:Uncharacterized protein n=1 Tax=Cutaneotrichosporon cavernicola TaxID=279322 RepID=A0AA48IE28_9TREE|nr:uncharacterized protein CcaverHIS019_0208080 [Cutaneotrichosporon cavernicola]BEI81648.1 hypothetical protein CcaverHIS002_0208080 [Cutaneotrichosporon cavernicola]BEI89446.1 hypothetical protein CcaverHIS019_0208080 [Cutaneotrichosporon cavernicola]BEI97220.1 hypothetical protein CcaverHIS631_0208090 [Cutaneotrichosporon cavernicola]BEJ04994.1 hypothetical protein CcaverHIS641_0208110 [Cutaneotrichosporon cavernicola]
MADNALKLSNDQYSTLLQAFGYPAAGCFFTNFTKEAAVKCRSVNGSPGLAPNKSANAQIWFCRLSSNATAADTDILVAKLPASSHRCFTASGGRRAAALYLLPLLAALLPVLLV